MNGSLLLRGLALNTPSLVKSASLLVFAVFINEGIISPDAVRYTPELSDVARKPEI